MAGFGSAPVIPQDVLLAVRSIFQGCNDDVASALSAIPTIHEESLDQLLIGHLARIPPTASPSSGWIIDLQTHFLGGGHHYGRWEIADIGVLIALRRGSNVVWSKVALLQSKRLFPLKGQHDKKKREEEFRWGFGRLHESYNPLRPSKTYTFTEGSRYASLDLRDDQAQRAILYEQEMGFPVHYLLYNPTTLPLSRTLPVTPGGASASDNEIGCRVIRADQLVSLGPALSVPRYRDLATLAPPHNHAAFHAGWRLEDFIATLLIGCHEGKVLDRSVDDTVRILFYRRAYPIAAAFVVNIEMAD